jgi:hypothetical protein
MLVFWETRTGVKYQRMNRRRPMVCVATYVSKEEQRPPRLIWRRRGNRSRLAADHENRQELQSIIPHIDVWWHFRGGFGMCCSMLNKENYEQGVAIGIDEWVVIFNNWSLRPTLLTEAFAIIAMHDWRHGENRVPLWESHLSIKGRSSRWISGILVYFILFSVFFIFSNWLDALVIQLSWWKFGCRLILVLNSPAIRHQGINIRLKWNPKLAATHSFNSHEPL